MENYEKGSIIVTFDSGEVNEELVTSRGLQVLNALRLIGTLIVGVPEGEERKWVEEFKKIPGVSASVNGRMELIR